ncbi:MAG: alanine racemase [Tissierellia bacterium]|jgi:alanine racemase|nr:alanine racemase [Tissierellia bacterium]MDD3226267.1 alanine racemase [Tissierellia bacterium]MDD3751863.1 alanine racemase [Tissierellia bacterium]MDD4045999.1 alanine racemase [Tissierellia bacterium]MDD4678437.1 alanine racemase [Tissierellia bacterium]
MNEKLRPAWVEVNREKAIHNFLEVRRAVGPDRKICAVVKADSYGMGSLELSKMYFENGVDMFAVAVIGEAFELRKEIKDKDILVLGFTSEEFYDDAIENNIILTIYDYNHAVRLNEAAKRLHKEAKIHIKVETGMNRLGFLPTVENADKIADIAKFENIIIEGAFSHQAKADEKDKTTAHMQADRFIKFMEMLKERNVEIPIKHIANSATIIELPEYYFDMVRPGIILSGFYPSDEVDTEKYIFKICVTLKAKVANVKTIEAGEGVGYGHLYHADKQVVVGTIPLGYADGYSRLLSNKGYVVVKGVKCPILGKVCMDQFMVDLSNVENPQIDDVAIVYGDGTDGAMTAEDVANMRGTISYEVLTNLAVRRLPKIYV